MNIPCINNLYVHTIWYIWFKISVPQDDTVSFAIYFRMHKKMIWVSEKKNEIKFGTSLLMSLLPVVVSRTFSLSSWFFWRSSNRFCLKKKNASFNTDISTSTVYSISKRLHLQHTTNNHNTFKMKERVR